MTGININEKALKLLMSRWADRFASEKLKYVEIPLIDMERVSTFEHYSEMVYEGKLGVYSFDGVDYKRGVVRYSVK